MNFLKSTSVLIWLFLLFSCKTTYHVTNTENNRIGISDSLQENQKIKNMILPYKTSLDEKMNRILTYNPFELNKKGANYLLGNLVADLMLDEANQLYTKIHPNQTIDAALTNSGGLRRSFAPGNLSVRSMYELMPFESELVVLTLSSESFVNMVKYLQQSDSFHPIAGFSFEKNSELLNILINGKPVEKQKEYRIVTNDYLAKGGDEMSFFNNPIQYETFNVKIRDLLIERIGKMDTLTINNNPRYILK